jgi:hypothetical protein
MVFTFEVDGGTVPLNATLGISAPNAISLASGPAQLQPSSAGPAVPPLSYLNIKENGISLQAAANPSGDRQGLEVVVAVIPEDPTLTLKFGYQNVEVLGYYQFTGYNRVQLKPGTNVVSFPQ